MVSDIDFFVVDLRDVSGRPVWGGFDARGAARTRILAPATSVAYAGPALSPGALYQWRVYGAKENTLVVSNFDLVTASEALIGEFTVARD